MTEILQTSRLVLREMTMEDLPFIASLVGNAEVMRYFPQVCDLAEAKAWIERTLDRYQRDGCGFWLTLDKATEEPIGQVGLLMQNVDGETEPEIGYLIHRPFWRQGYAMEAALGVRHFAFDTLNHDHVISLIRPENAPSQGVARKLGMTKSRMTMFEGFQHIVFRVDRHRDTLSR